MSSYRAEAYGKLSWIIFIKHFLEFAHITPECLFHSYLDNLEIVNHTQLSSNLTFASAAIIPDYDILIAISNEQRTLSSLCRLPNTQHVRGHQDQSKSHHQLTRPEQLNVRADQLATKALQEISTSKKEFPSQANPHCPIYLLNQGYIISSKEQSTLRWKWSELRLQLYYRDKFKLKVPQLFQINWFGHHSARRTFSPSEINFSIKLTINWLPIGKMAERYGDIITQCHRCNDPETLHHLFSCRQNIKAQQQYIKQLDASLISFNTDPDIRQTIVHGISIHINAPSKYSVPSHLQHSFNTQSQFGWQLVCSGLLLQMWSEHQQNFVNITPYQHSHLAGDTWNRKVSTTLIQAHSLWTSRCSEVHDRPHTFTKAELEANAQIQRFYDQSTTLSSALRDAIFSTPIEIHIEKGPKHITQWIRRNAKILKRMQAISKKQLTIGQPTITQFFRPISHRTTPHLNNRLIVTTINKPQTQSELTTLERGC
jgi:hypothetical protein